MDKKYKFSFVCNIVAAVCFAIVGFGDLMKGETAVAWLFIGLFVLQLVMIAYWIRRFKRDK